MEVKTAAAAGAGVVTLPIGAVFVWLTGEISDLEDRIRAMEVDMATTQQDVAATKESAEEIHSILDRAFPRAGATPGG
jgi:hypothetical protein